MDRGRICNESAVTPAAPRATLADIFSSVKTGGCFNWTLLVLLGRARRARSGCFVFARAFRGEAVGSCR